MTDTSRRAFLAGMASTPLLLDPLHGQAALEALASGAIPARQAAASDGRKLFRVYGSGMFVQDGVAVIDVEGVLVHRLGFEGSLWGMATGYDGIARQIRAARADPNVRAIWLDIDSPGGFTAGCFSLAEEIAKGAKSEGGKPVWAFVNEMACSAAYALASVCDKVFAPEDAVIGSIGVYCDHLDLTAMLENDGVKLTRIRSGEQKARGGPAEPLDERTAAKLQTWVDQGRQRFAALVGMGRRMSKAAVLATEGDWFSTAQAIELGLCDEALSETAAWAKLQRSLKRAA